MRYLQVYRHIAQNKQNTDLLLLLKTQKQSQ